MIPISTIHFKNVQVVIITLCFLGSKDIFTFVVGHCGCVEGIGRATFALINRGKNDIRVLPIATRHNIAELKAP